MKLNENCKSCLLKKYIHAYPSTASLNRIASYQAEVGNAIAQCGDMSAPQIVERIHTLQYQMFDAVTDYSEIKRHFNSLMLSLVPHMRSQIQNAQDPLKQAVQYAMAGNYIDFAALQGGKVNDL